MNFLDHVHLFEGTPSKDFAEWITNHRDDIVSALREQGAVFFRGFMTDGDCVAEDALRPLSSELLDDAFWSTPRAGVKGKTFTATEYPGPRTIPLHSEMAYMTSWPRLLAFHSIEVAAEGGQTTIGNIDRITAGLTDVIDQFEDGVLYRRHYHQGVDIPWQTAFQTENRSEVSAIAKKAHMEIEWLDGDSLRTQHRAQGVVRDEEGRPLWFNQAHLFHASNLSATDRATLTDLFGEDQLPRNALFGSGRQIPDDLIEKIHAVMTKHTMGIDWQPGDVAVIDNMRHLHGRLPYSGTRKLHVAMAAGQSKARRTPLLEEKQQSRLGRLWSRLTR
jgi:alpha-ketoglutarate-dependent taurine dioxygenase